MISIRPATPADADYVATHIRPADAQESLKFTGRALADVLQGNLIASELAFVVCYKERPVILFGVTPYLDEDNGVGCVWLRATKEIHKVSRWALRNAPRILEEFRGVYPSHLVAFASIENSVHLRWLDAIGFQHRGWLNVDRELFSVASRDYNV